MVLALSHLTHFSERDTGECFIEYLGYNSPAKRTPQTGHDGRSATQDVALSRAGNRKEEPQGVGAGRGSRNRRVQRFPAQGKGVWCLVCTKS